MVFWCCCFCIGVSVGVVVFCVVAGAGFFVALELACAEGVGGGGINFWLGVVELSSSMITISGFESSPCNACRCCLLLQKMEGLSSRFKGVQV